MTQQISGCRLRKLPLWNLGELQFEFLELSDQFEHEVKAVGLQLKIMVTSQCPSNDTYATRCLTRDCSNVSNVEGTCLYKMIVIGSLQDSFLKLIILARFWRTRDSLAEPTAANNYIFESVQQPLQAYRLERPREWLHEQRQTDCRMSEPEITQANREEDPSEIQGRTSLVANLARQLVQALEGGPGSQDTDATRARPSK